MVVLINNELKIHSYFHKLIASDRPLLHIANVSCQTGDVSMVRLAAPMHQFSSLMANQLVALQSVVGKQMNCAKSVNELLDDRRILTYLS